MAEMSNADEAYLREVILQCYGYAEKLESTEDALTNFLFSFTDVSNKEGYDAALKRFIAAKRQARVVLGLNEVDDDC